MTRAGVRNKIAALLAAEGSFGTRVYKARVTRFPEGGLPAACVYFDGEDVEAGRKGSEGRRLNRMAEFVVEAVAQAPTEEELETTLDTLTGTVEATLTADNTLEGTAKACDVQRVAYERDDDEEAHLFTGAALLTFAIWYESTEGE